MIQKPCFCEDYLYSIMTYAVFKNDKKFILSLTWIQIESRKLLANC